MTDLRELFERHAKWQKTFRELPWAEKVRLAARLRDSVRKLRQTAPPATPSGSEQVTPAGRKGLRLR